ncbi:MAG: hypothetical protein CV089_13505 [Nitrospira sp. WS110]|nr:hypothetical protein [Nitrospira sp. WS110]
MISSALESWAFWTGLATVGFTAVAVILGFFKSTDRTRKVGEVCALVAALLGCLSWWLSITVSEMKQEDRARFEREHESKMKVAEAEVSKAREGTAAANERAGRLEVEAASLRERTTRSEYKIKIAEAQAEEAKKEAAQAGEGTAKALAETAAAKERTIKLEVEAAALRERAARAETELLKIQARITPRRIPDNKRSRLVDILKLIPKGPISIQCLLGDQESRMFATQIRDALKEAGWTDVGFHISVFNKTMTGLELRFRDRTKIPDFGMLIAHALDSVGLPLSLGIHPKVAEGEVEIVVGAKPDSP